MRIEYDGLCPKCGEHTSVTSDDNGCCDAGCEHEGSIVYSDDIEPIVESESL